ncbi:MAG: hypothetical protein MJ058_04845 [Akkermansia sp.]|nr:hypothetical protein [Akkermansia sp.]
MRRVYTIILGTLAGLLLLLALFCQIVANSNMALDAWLAHILKDLESQCVKVDSAAPLPENEGCLVSVRGTLRLVNCPVLEDKLLGVRKRTVALDRWTLLYSDDVYDGHNPHQEKIELPSGLKVQPLHQKAPADWTLGGFRIHWMGRGDSLFEGVGIPLAEMNPVPEVLQEATPNKMELSYAGPMKLWATYSQMRETIETTFFGMQRGNEIVPYHYTIPRSHAVGPLLESIIWDDETMSEEEIDIMGCDSLDSLLDSVLPYRRDEKLSGIVYDFCIMLGVGGTLLAMLLLAVMLRFCLHRRVGPCMLYVGGGMLLLTLLNIWNAHWVW